MERISLDQVKENFKTMDIHGNYELELKKAITTHMETLESIDFNNTIEIIKSHLNDIVEGGAIDKKYNLSLFTQTLNSTYLHYITEYVTTKLVTLKKSIDMLKQQAPSPILADRYQLHTIDFRNFSKCLQTLTA